MATTRLAGLSPEIGFFAFLAGSLAFAIFGGSRFLSCGADSTITPIFAGGLAPIEFAIREQTGIGRDDGSTKLKHQSAVEIESENLAVRITPFWPKLRLSMSI
jgi:MFS superfamily sulfate permease-like transporter